MSEPAEKQYTVVVTGTCYDTFTVTASNSDDAEKIGRDLFKDSRDYAHLLDDIHAESETEDDED